MGSECARGQRRGARAWGVAGLCGVAAAVGLMAAVGVLGPSRAEPPVGPPSPSPPWFVLAHPSDVLVTALLWAAIVIGTLSVVAGLVAVRRGWCPHPGRLLVGALIATAVLVVVPPLGSTDLMDYVAYGRIAALGDSPYTVTPIHLKHIDDPVGDYTPKSWERTPSVYGPVATATQWAASKLAGTSARGAEVWLKVWNGLAFLAAALALDRLARPDRARRVRAQLMWSLNPLMLWAVLAGGHNDGLGASLAALAIFALTRSGFAAGALFGAAIAVKAPFVLIGAGLAWAARRSPRKLAAGALGAVAVLVPAYLLSGPAALAVLTHRVGVTTGFDPWWPVTHVLNKIMTRREYASAFGKAVLLVGFVAGLLLCWRLPRGHRDLPAVRPALAFSLGWLLTAPYLRPWYDAIAFPLLALMPASRLDWVLLARSALTAVAYLPGMPNTLHPAWLEAFRRDLFLPWAVPTVLDLLTLVLVVLCWRGAWTAPHAVWRDDTGRRPRPMPAPP